MFTKSDVIKTQMFSFESIILLLSFLFLLYYHRIFILFNLFHTISCL